MNLRKVAVVACVFLALAVVIACVLVLGPTKYGDGNSVRSRLKDIPSSPHIVYILADDLGWDDVSFHGSSQIPTPNIDALASDGVILHNYYVPSICTPSRGSFFTGRYPPRIGLQHYALRSVEPTGLPLNFTLLPAYLKRLGYATHAVGKWHLGHYKKEYTPTSRGFDTFFGYFSGFIDYYDHTSLSHYTNPEFSTSWGIDLHDGMTPVKHKQGNYATHMFTEKAENIIKNHNTTQPLFLFLSHLAVHTGNAFSPIQPPPEYLDSFHYIEDVNRRMFAGVVKAMDDSVGRIFQVLDETGILDNAVVVFSSDNGAASWGFQGGIGSNWPLRGMKCTLWEGGLRANAVIWSPLLKNPKGRISKQLMHVTDWLPTLYHLAGGKTEDLGDIDGVNMWESLVQDQPSPRKEILHNIDPIWQVASLTLGNYKVVQGSSYNGIYDGWFHPPGRNGTWTTESMDEWVWQNGSLVGKILKQRRRKFPPVPNSWRKDAELECGPVSPTANCNPTVSPCLFDITNDPCEMTNLATMHPEIVNKLMERIRWYNSSSVPPVNKLPDPQADPRRSGFMYTTWRDEL